MPRRRLLAVWSITWFVPTGWVSASDQPRPNIVFFLVDDLGWQDTSVPMGSERVPQNDHFRTPHLEALAATGVRFSQAYASAVCSPTRTSWMTGQNAARHHVTNWTLFADRDQSGRTARLDAPTGWRTEGLQPDDVTLPSLLRDAGYRTIHVGKAHFGANGTQGVDPRALGFDVNIAGHAAGAPGSYQGTDDYGRSNETWAVPGLKRYHGLPIHLTDALTVEAIRAVEGAVADEAPFFLYLAHYAVHTPIQPHDPYVDRYRDLGLDEKEARYASMVEGFDQSLGAVVQALARLGVAEETLVVFASDNGGLSAHGRGTSARGTGKDTHNWPLKAGKGSAYEGGTRIPQVIGWARVADVPQQRDLPVDAGRLEHAPTIIEDLFPTFLRMAGVDAAGRTAHDVDGRDVTPLLSASSPRIDAERRLRAERPLLFHYPHVWGPKGLGYEPHSSLRVGDWKVVYFYEPRRFELYHLGDDLGETRDLAAAQPARLAEMAAALIDALESRGAQYPTHRELERPEPPVLLHAVARGPDDGATPLVLVHGWSGDHQVWHRQLDAWSEARRVLAVDLPGHGRSLAPTGEEGNAVHSLAGYADAVAMAMDRQGVERAVLIGHSNGVPVVREVLRRHPERVAGIVTLDGALRPMTTTPEATDAMIAPLRGDAREPFLERMSAGFPTTMSDADIARLTGPLFDTPASVQIASFRVANGDAANLPVEWPVPLLAIHAESPWWSDEYEQHVRGLCDDVQYETWPGVGHFLMWDAPGRLHETVRDWLEARGL